MELAVHLGKFDVGYSMTLCQLSAHICVLLYNTVFESRNSFACILITTLGNVLNNH